MFATKVLRMRLQLRKPVFLNILMSVIHSDHKILLSGKPLLFMVGSLFQVKQNLLINGVLGMMNLVQEWKQPIYMKNQAFIPYPFH